MAIKKKALTELHAKSLSEAFAVALKWTTRANDGGLFWFRGVKDSRLELEPGAYWRNSYDEFGPLIEFVQEGGAFTDVGEMSDWKTYYLAQHHGIPTRLLDWSESFSAALFFALDNWKGKTSPCIWIVRPECINRISIGWEGLLAPEQIEPIKNWLPHRIKDGAKKVPSPDGSAMYDSALPLALYPRKSNVRMIAQQAAFTVHGTERLKLNRWIVEREKDHDKIICKVILDGLDKDSVLGELATLGVRRHTMYPDLANYVLYLRESWKW